MEQGISDPNMLQNLADAGCDGETMRRFCELEKCGAQETSIRKEQVRLLCVQRKALLCQLHSCEAQLDCLDFLLYKLKGFPSGKEGKKTDER